MKRTLLFALTALPVIAGGEAAAQVFPQASTEASPIIYKINSYSRGGCLTIDANGTTLKHKAPTANSFWRFESVPNTTNNGMYVYNLSTKTALASGLQAGATPIPIYILSNGFNEHGAVISVKNPIVGNDCYDANNNNDGIGAHRPQANDWEGTTWVFEQVNANGEFVLTPATLPDGETAHSHFDSEVITLPSATNKIRFTVLGTNTGAAWEGYTFFTLAEFNMYKEDGTKINLTAENFSTNAQEGSEGQIAGICDGDKTTYFHSRYQGQSVGAYHYIEVTLPEEVQKFKFSFDSRNQNNIPAAMVISTSNQVAREALQAAITSANNAAEGTGFNQYTKDDAFKAALTAAQKAIANASTTTESLISTTTTLNTAIANALNRPKDGQFIRVKTTSTSRPAMPYLSSANSTFSGKTERAAYVTSKEGDNEASTILYYKDGKLLAFSNGFYLANNSNFLGYNGVTTGTNFSFDPAQNGAIGCYNVKFNNERYLYAQLNGSNYFTDAGNSAPADQYNFLLEEVTTLPVTISGAGYASFYTPVALTIPAESGLEVYTGNVNTADNTLELTAVNGTLPAGSAVILKGAEGKYDFAITTSDATASNGSLTGQAATINKEAAATNIYTLQAPAAGVGMYKYTGTTLAGFKAYLQTTGASAVAGFRFGGTTTGIESILNTADGKAPAAVYDLQGRRVEKAGKGLYIINGQKVLFK